MRRIHWFIACLPLIAAPLAAQDEEPATPPAEEEPAPPTAGEVEIPDPGTPVEDPAVARQEVVRFQGEFKDAKKDEAKQVELLGRLGAWDHPLIFKEASKYLRDRSYQVAVAAVVAVARQSTSADKAGRALFGILRREKRTDVVCASLVGMGRLGFTERGVYDEVQKMFVQGPGEIRKAAARYFGYVKAKEAFRLLAENLDEPHSTLPPDDPRNPPASYWEEKWKEWNSNRPYYRWALSQIVEGETFETTDEARMWAESEDGRERGITWD